MGMRRPMRRRHSVRAFRSTPSTYSMTMKYVSSECPMSNTCTMFACWSDSDRRASSRNIATNFLFLVRLGRIRLMAMFFRNPCIDSATPRQPSAIPREPTPARLLGRGLLAFTLLFAVDAQRRHRPREQPAERDRLAALLANVDLVVVETDQLLRNLAEQEFLPIVQPHLGREDLFLHR